MRYYPADLTPLTNGNGPLDGAQRLRKRKSAVRGCKRMLRLRVRLRPGNSIGRSRRWHARVLRLLLTFKGSIFYALREPMGDFLFAPLYTYLRERKVKFRFFHRLDALHSLNDGSEIEEIALGRQVKLEYPDGEYEPLIDVPGKPFESWPTHPDYARSNRGPFIRDTRSGISRDRLALCGYSAHAETTTSLAIILWPA